MILVDSSVWIEVLRGRLRDRYATAIAADQVVTCLPIRQEVLQGIDQEAAYHAAVKAFAYLPTLEDPLTADIFDEAVQLYRTARRAGVTIRSSVDCLIAACALRHDATVLHLDRDFDYLVRIAPLKARRL